MITSKPSLRSGFDCIIRPAPSGAGRTTPSQPGHYPLIKTHVHPCEKVIGIFFQNQIWSRLLDINRLCLICIKRSIEEVKMCQIYKRGYQKGPSDETLKKARYQFCDVKFGHRITVAMGLFDYKMCNLPQFPLISQTGEARVLFHDLLMLFCINDIFVNYTQLK